MIGVEIQSDGSFLVSEERVNNDILKWICEFGSIQQLNKILKERMERRNSNETD